MNWEGTSWDGQRQRVTGSSERLLWDRCARIGCRKTDRQMTFLMSFQVVKGDVGLREKDGSEVASAAASTVWACSWFLVSAASSGEVGISMMGRRVVSERLQDMML